MPQTEARKTLKDAPIMWRRINSIGMILDCNSTYAANLGYAKSEILGKPIFEHVSKESWGITAMEALGCGVPVILLVDDTDTHASESIAADSSHYIKIRKKCSKEEFESAARKAIAIPESKRRDIASMTKRKHSLTNWKLSIDKMISLRYNDATGKPKTLMEFFV